MSGLLTALPAFALECSPIDPDRVAAEAEFAFVGRAISVVASDYSPNDICWKAETREAQCGGKIATFDVTRSIKGTASGQVRVLAEDGCYCLGAYFTKGGEYLVVGSKNPTPFPADVLAKNVCWGTGPVQGELSQKIIDRLSHVRR
jgi:hypothetical protein